MLQHIQHNSLSRLSLVIFALALLPACAKKIGAMAEKIAVFEDAKENISVRVHCIDADESKARFGKNLLSYGYQPLSLTVYNDSDDALLFRASSIDLPLETGYDTAKSAHTPTLAYTAVPAYLAGLFFWPALIPVAGAGFWMMSNNQQLTRNVAAQSFEGDMGVEILPYDRMSKVLLVKSGNLPPSFSLHLFNIHKKIFIPFTIAIKD